MTKIVKNRNMIFGDGNVTVQSMTNLPVTDLENTAEQIKRLVSAGCDIVRVAVPNMDSAAAFGKLRRLFPDLPLVADIHFDYRLAIAALDAGADKIRINPGNILQTSLNSVIDCAKANDAIIRIGVNGGSVNKECLVQCHGDKCAALTESVRQYVEYFQDRGFNKIVLSAKSSDAAETVKINRLLASNFNYPLHLGVTEAGLWFQGAIKNAVGIGSLLLDGIGDTVRVSLTADPVKEVETAREILRATGRLKGVTFVSCPKCGRCSIDLERVAAEVYEYAKNIDLPLKIAVMGCEVNGPGECADADLGLAGANGKMVFFKHGKRYKTAEAQDGVELFKREIDLLVKTHCYDKG